MEGIYVRFKETDHSIWIGTHEYGMVKSSPNSWSSASIRKLYTVGDALNSFKTAVAPDVDGSSITLHFEPTKEPIPSDCLLAAIQLENSFENPLYIKCSPSVSSIKSKDSDSVRYGKRKGEIFLDNESAIDFNLQPTTTMTTPHKLVKLEGATYFIGLRIWMKLSRCLTRRRVSFPVIFCKDKKLMRPTPDKVFREVEQDGVYVLIPASNGSVSRSNLEKFGPIRQAKY
jgi:hypothetical protein